MIPTYSFRSMQKAIRQQPLYTHCSAYLWQSSLSIRNQFCEAVTGAGYLTWEQMLNAACRYCVGATKHGGVIFWQIDHEGRVHDGKVMYYLPDCHRNKSKAAHPTWVSALLTRREKAGHRQNTTSHCFFGQHLLTNMNHTNLSNHSYYSNDWLSPSGHRAKPSCSLKESAVCIVEAEKTAFILSELYPNHIWLAAGGLGEVQPDKFRALRGHRVILFPDTDADGITFQRWTEAARIVMRAPFWEDSPPIRVSSILEAHASPEQKQRKIDLVDYLFENNAVKLRE